MVAWNTDEVCRTSPSTEHSRRHSDESVCAHVCARVCACMHVSGGVILKVARHTELHKKDIPNPK